MTQSTLVLTDIQNHTRDLFGASVQASMSNATIFSMFRSVADSPFNVMATYDNKIEDERCGSPYEYGRIRSNSSAYASGTGVIDHTVVTTEIDMLLWKDFFKMQGRADRSHRLLPIQVIDVKV